MNRCRRPKVPRWNCHGGQCCGPSALDAAPGVEGSVPQWAQRCVEDLAAASQAAVGGELSGARSLRRDTPVDQLAQRGRLLSAEVIAVSAKPKHGVNKANRPVIRLLAGEGVEGDAHCGVTVKHRSRWRRDPTQPNIRQVHLLHAELLEALVSQGFTVTPGLMGENITTRGIDLLGLPTGAILQLGDAARVQITGLRNPCYQLDALQPGLMAACLEKRGSDLIRKAGVMSVVLVGGEVRAGDLISVELPPGEPVALKPV